MYILVLEYVLVHTYIVTYNNNDAAAVTISGGHRKIMP